MAKKYPEGLTWINGNSEGISYVYAIDKNAKRYYLQIKTKIPRRFYNSFLNDIGLEIEKKHWEDLKS